jgi:CheY-like chemotaxis protein
MFCNARGDADFVGDDLEAGRSPDSKAAGEPISIGLQMAQATKKLRILVVDDNADGADMLALLVSGEGHDVWTAYNGQAGLDLALRQRPDIVFLDIGLPILDGYEVARRIRADATLRGTLVVAVTAYGAPGDKAKAMAAGFDFHLTKPVESRHLEMLMRTIEEMK